MTFFGWPTSTLKLIWDILNDGLPVGGTTGQVLAKASNADRDSVWVDAGGPGGGYDGDVSTGELDTGSTWTSDEPVFRRALTAASGPLPSDFVEVPLPMGFVALTKAYGVLKGASESLALPHPDIVLEADTMGGNLVVTNRHAMNDYSGYELIVVLEYTKS